MATNADPLTAFTIVTSPRIFHGVIVGVIVASKLLSLSPSRLMRGSVKASTVPFERCATCAAGPFTRSMCEPTTYMSSCRSERSRLSAPSTHSRHMRLDGCDAMATGERSTAPGRTKAANGTCGNERSLALAIDYVLNGQGEDLPELE